MMRPYILVVDSHGHFVSNTQKLSFYYIIQDKILLKIFNKFTDERNFTLINNLLILFPSFIETVQHQ